MAWTPDRLPSLAGKTFLVTGGNSGLGEEATCILASKGARVLFTSRRDDKADAALERIRRSVPDAIPDLGILRWPDGSLVEYTPAHDGVEGFGDSDGTGDDRFVGEDRVIRVSSTCGSDGGEGGEVEGPDCAQDGGRDYCTSAVMSAPGSRGDPYKWRAFDWDGDAIPAECL